MDEIILTCEVDETACAVSSAKMAGRDVVAVNSALLEISIAAKVSIDELDESIPIATRKKIKKARLKKLATLMDEFKGIYVRLFDSITVQDIDGKVLTSVEDIFSAIDNGDLDGAVSAWVMNLPDALYEERQKLGKVLRGN